MTIKAARRPELKFLADVNIEKRLVDYLTGIGFDIKWIPDYECGMPDDVLLDLVKSENRILLTNDKDFGKLVFLQKKASEGIILFRIKGQDVYTKIRLVERLLKEFGDRLSRQFTVVTDKKIRFIPLEDSK
jgi:predicted nuclease of predicted toxin-antitoxin system